MAEYSVGFCGLGAMGAGMATNLLAAMQQRNQTLYVWNRSASKAQPLVDKGAAYVDSLVEIASRCAVVHIMLGDDTALQAVFSEYIKAPARPKDAIFVDHSTVAPKLTSQLAEVAKSKNVQYISAPVFGRPDAALAKQLLICPAGKPSAKAKVRPNLEAMGRGLVDLGDSPQQGSVLKLVGNFFISSFIEICAEGMTLGERNGVSRGIVVDLVHQLFPGRIPTGYAERMAQDAFSITPESPGFSCQGGTKDVGHVIQLGRDSGVAMHVAEVMLGHLQEICSAPGGKDLDWGAVAKVVRDAADLPQT